MLRLRQVTLQGRRRGLAAKAIAGIVALALASCGPANDRPRSGAVSGSGASTPAGVPPTLTPSDGLAIHVAVVPSPALEPTPSPMASPSALAVPPIVRTIVPGANGRVPAGPTVALSAVLVGRGADLASASLSVNGVDTGAQIDKRTPREWSIHTNQTLGVGSYTVRVGVRDASGIPGGFTWQFLVGNEGDRSTPAVQPSPATQPRSP